MNLLGFLKLVEIQTKAASMLPFFIGSIIASFRYRQFNMVNFIFMLISLLSFDMATTAINNYIDYKKANKRYGYGFEEYNSIVKNNLNEPSVVIVIILLVTIAIVFGILLFNNTSLLLLIIGIISFAVGVLYTFGPLPISRMPLGEFFSGFFMGFIIIFLSIYIHIVNLDLFELSMIDRFLHVKINLQELLILFLLSLPSSLSIANIMLANNICDIEDDIENHRYTLPIYIGKVKSLSLFKILYYIIFLDIGILLLVNILPMTLILMFLITPFIIKNINIFLKYQSKKHTFIISLKNFIIINVSLASLLFIHFIIFK